MAARAEEDVGYEQTLLSYGSDGELTVTRISEGAQLDVALLRPRVLRLESAIPASMAFSLAR